MNELQGAVGIVQLRKFQKLFNIQNKNRNRIINKIKSIKDIVIREKPKNSTEAPEALIFSFRTNKLSKKFRDKFLKKGYSTKILPEAITWHFSGSWSHIKELELKKNNNFKKSKEILDKCVAIPIQYKMKQNFPNIVQQTIKEVI